MNVSEMPGSSRREFLGNTGRAVAASALAGVAIPAVHAGENHTIQLALVGCGGRGTGAAANALATKSGPIKLVALADVFEHRLKIRRLQEGHGLPQAWRRRSPDHPLRVPVGPFRPRHRQGHQRPHGEADDRRWTKHAEDAGAG